MTELADPPATTTYKPGDKVYHPLYGNGEIERLYPDNNLIIDVRFRIFVIPVKTSELTRAE